MITCRKCNQELSDAELEHVVARTLITGKAPDHNCFSKFKIGISKEKYVEHKFLKKETGAKGYDMRRNRIGKNCPKCDDEGKTLVDNLTDFYYCENPDCPVTRHFDGGYYIIVETDKEPVRILKNNSDVQLVGSLMKRQSQNNTEVCR